MTLVSSGAIGLIYSGTPTRSIKYEITGSYTGSYGIQQARTASNPSVGPLPIGLTDFYGLNQCGASTPAIPGSRTASEPFSGVIQVSWASVAAADDYTHRRSTNGSTWTNTLTTTSTSYSTSIASGNWYWQVRSNNCAGSSSYGNMSPYPINI